MNRDARQLNFIIDSIGLVLIGLISLGYSFFHRRFAELHLSLPFLDFPVFIGEILLFVCFMLLCIKWIHNPKKAGALHHLLFIYFLFVLIKALYGYFKWGPLAFRHAALFYYPLFTIFGYTFYNRAFFDNRKILFLSILFIVGLSPFFIRPSDYFLLTYFLLAAVVIKAYPHRAVRHIFLFLLIVFTPYKLFFETSRTGLVSNVAAALFTVTTLIFISKLKRVYKVRLFAAAMVLILVGVLKLSAPIAVRSLVDLQSIIKTYNNYNAILMAEKDSFKMKEYKPKIYNPEIKAKTAEQKSEEPEHEREQAKLHMEKLQIEKRQGQLILEETQTTVQKAKLQIEELQSMVKELQLAKKQTKSEIEEKTPIQPITKTEREPGSAPQLAQEEPELPAVVNPEKKAEPEIEEEAEQPRIQLAKQTEIQIEKAQAEIRKTQLQMRELQRKLEETQARLEKAEIKTDEAQTNFITTDYINKGLYEKMLSSAYCNIFFRIFIWRDMLMQFKEEKPLLFGFDFGKPLRSKSIEILKIAEGDWRVEWGGCGWITAHNSFLDIFYRSSIIGVIYVVTVFIFLFKIIRQSIKFRLVNGVLFCGALIHWIVAANFLVILEVPYNAIPFWSLFGMSFAYLKSLKE